MKCLFLLIVLHKVGVKLTVECQGFNDSNDSNDSNTNSISRDIFYYDNYNGYKYKIFEIYFAWISIKNNDKDKDRDKERDKTIKVKRLVLGY